MEHQRRSERDGSWRPVVRVRPGFASEAQLYVIPPRRSCSAASGPVFGGQEGGGGDGSHCGKQQSDSVELAISVLGKAFEANIVTDAQRRQLQLLLNKDLLADSMKAASLDDLALPDSPMPDAARIRQERPTVLSAALHECVDLQPSRTPSLAEHYRQRYGTALVSENVTPSASSNDPKDELPSYRTPLVVEIPSWPPCEPRLPTSKTSSTRSKKSKTGHEAESRCTLKDSRRLLSVTPSY